MFAIPVKRKYKSEYDKKTAKFAANNIGGVKRKDRCCSYYCGPAKYLPSWTEMEYWANVCRVVNKGHVDVYHNIY